MSVAFTTPAIILPPEAPTAPLSLVYERTVQIPIPTSEPPKKLCQPQCIPFVRQFIPELPFMNTPADLQGNSKPQKGCAVLLDNNHIGYIPLITNEGIFVQDANSDYNCSIRNDAYYEFGDDAIRGIWCANKL